VKQQYQSPLEKIRALDALFFTGAADNGRRDISCGNPTDQDRAVSFSFAPASGYLL
jgi:hypothetical protein